MDLTKIRAKLIGNDDERAVSPVIGVILMVAITVILAAVIAAFVLDLGQSTSAPVQAAVDVDVENDAGGNDGEVTFTVRDMGSADEFVVRGDSSHFDSVDEIELGDLDNTGDVQTIEEGGGSEFTNDAEGEFTVVGISGDDESAITNFEVDMS